MEALQKVNKLLQTINTKQFYIYSGIFMASVLLIEGVVLWRYYAKTALLKKEINFLNISREEAQDIFTRAQRVEKQQKEVDTILSQDKNFKIAGYFKEMISQLGLNEKQKIAQPQSIDRDDNYIETVVNAKFTQMNMKDIAILLQSIEQNLRLYTKELEIVRSTKMPSTLEVKIIVATLLPKTSQETGME
jgi:hypothetical protein